MYYPPNFQKLIPNLFHYIKKKMLPVRCFTCNKVIGRFQDVYDAFLKTHNHDNKQLSENFVDFFQRHGITRYCCRKIFLTHIDIYQHCTPFQHEMIECRSQSEIPVIYRAI